MNPIYEPPPAPAAAGPLPLEFFSLQAYADAVTGRKLFLFSL